MFFELVFAYHHLEEWNYTFGKNEKAFKQAKLSDFKNLTYFPLI